MSIKVITFACLCYYVFTYRGRIGVYHLPRGNFYAAWLYILGHCLLHHVADIGHWQRCESTSFIICFAGQNAMSRCKSCTDMCFYKKNKRGGVWLLKYFVEKFSVCVSCFLTSDTFTVPKAETVYIDIIMTDCAWILQDSSELSIKLDFYVKLIIIA